MGEAQFVRFGLGGPQLVMFPQVELCPKILVPELNVRPHERDELRNVLPWPHFPLFAALAKPKDGPKAEGDGQKAFF